MPGDIANIKLHFWSIANRGKIKTYNNFLYTFIFYFHRNDRTWCQSVDNSRAFNSKHRYITIRYREKLHDIDIENYIVGQHYGYYAFSFVAAAVLRLTGVLLSRILRARRTRWCTHEQRGIT